MPSYGETVVCRITKVLDYGVFVEFLEYEGVTGFVHISQVASSWVKNIRNFVKVNQIRAAKVVHTDTSKNQIDVSFNKVSAGEQRAKIEAYGQLKKPQKLVEMVAKTCKSTPDCAWKEISEPLLEHYESLYDAFQVIKINGADAAKGVPEKYLKSLLDIIDKNIDIPQKIVRGKLMLTTTDPAGVELIKKALIDSKKAGEKHKGAKIDILYSGSGKYAVKIVSHDYKIAEAALKNLVDTAISEMDSAKGKGSFERRDE